MGDQLIITLALVGFGAAVYGGLRLGGVKVGATVAAVLLPVLTAFVGHLKGRRAGREDVERETKEAVDDFVEEADRLRRESDRDNADPDELRKSDGFRRD